RSSPHSSPTRRSSDLENGVMDEPMLRAWMTESVKPAAHHETLPGRWVTEPTWPPPERETRRLFLTDAGLGMTDGPLSAREIRSPDRKSTRLNSSHDQI